MRITYYALKDVTVGADTRHAGDLVPEAVDFPFIDGFVRDGRLAPVLVATLPEETQVMLLEWEAEQPGYVAQNDAEVPKAEVEATAPAKATTRTKEKV